MEATDFTKPRLNSGQQFRIDWWRADRGILYFGLIEWEQQCNHLGALAPYLERESIADSPCLQSRRGGNNSAADLQIRRRHLAESAEQFESSSGRGSRKSVRGEH